MSASTSEALASAVAEILPDGVVVAVGRIGEVPFDVREEERLFASACVPSRQREFFTGRSLARRALQTLGCDAGALLPDASGAPRWPLGVTGSVSHSGSLCVVAVATRERLRGVGVDVEPAEPLERELWPEICTDDERRWIEARPEAERGSWARWFFSAKEAVYKVQSPLTGVFLEFHDVTLLAHDPDSRTGRFSATLPRSAREKLACATVSGRYATHAGFLFTAAALPA
jgi:4'-phosphopantetheinyl transferase EntD